MKISIWVCTHTCMHARTHTHQHTRMHRHTHSLTPINIHLHFHPPPHLATTTQPPTNLTPPPPNALKTDVPQLTTHLWFLICATVTGNCRLETRMTSSLLSVPGVPSELSGLFWTPANGFSVNRRVKYCFRSFRASNITVAMKITAHAPTISVTDA